MTGVKTAILISEYYPSVKPPAGSAPTPIGRLTPFFHDITIENVTATGSKVAALVFGLPESPVRRLVMRHLGLGADVGMMISDAQATLDDVKVTAAHGRAVDIEPSASVMFR